MRCYFFFAVFFVAAVFFAPHAPLWLLPHAMNITSCKSDVGCSNVYGESLREECPLCLISVYHRSSGGRRHLACDPLGCLTTLSMFQVLSLTPNCPVSDDGR